MSLGGRKLSFPVVKGGGNKVQGKTQNENLKNGTKHAREETPDQKPVPKADKTPSKKTKAVSAAAGQHTMPSIIAAMAASPASSQVSHTSVEDLPDEVLRMILRYLPKYNDNLAARAVNRRWCGLAKDLTIVRQYFDLGDAWKKNEKKYAVLAHHPNNVSWLTLQPNLHANMRVVLVEWLIEVHHEFSLRPKTLFLAVAYLDRVLVSKPSIFRGRFQLIGLTCLWIASKFEDVSVNSLGDLVWICDDAYTRHDFENTEQEILRILEWRISQVTAVCWVDSFLARDEWQPSPSIRRQLRQLSHLLCELCLSEHGLLRDHLPSTLAAAALAYGRLMLTSQVPDKTWLQNLPGNHLAAVSALQDLHEAALARTESIVMAKYRLPGQAIASIRPVSVSQFFG